MERVAVCVADDAAAAVAAAATLQSRRQVRESRRRVYACVYWYADNAPPHLGHRPLDRSYQRTLKMSKSTQTEVEELIFCDDNLYSRN